MIEKIYSELAELEQVDAIVLGGSRASGNEDKMSDYDLYVYCSDKIPEEKRREIFEKYCDKMEIGNSFFEYEDNYILSGGTGLDVIYRSLDKLSQFMPYIVEQHHAMNGYTTCFWHNLITCEIIFDREGKFAEIQKRFSVAYPEELRMNIIRRNLALLCDGLPAYDKQILKAAKRKDIISINHRTAAFMESYFDIIFALNRLTHPGEKRLVEICQKKCRLLPDKFEKNISRLFADLYSNTDRVSEDLENIVAALKKLLRQNGILN
ncbi:MAG: DUF4037 domain-containing protein [Clostridia bacterium]|nr:DUF4037 domain-containing protein [Clostridia bacterium]